MLDLLAISHLMVTASYIFIPLQFCHCLRYSPHRHNMPWRLIFCLILVALFFMLCGMAHLLLALGYGMTPLFVIIQCGNALVSTTTAFYLIPLIPDMFTLLDNAVSKMQMETKDSKSKLFTFMAFLCHEIRNPLFAITSSAECLQDTTLTQDQMEEVSSICDSSLLMLRLVNDVLDLSKLDSGKLQLECREFDLHSLLKRLGDNMSRQVQRKHQGAVVLQCIIGPTVPQFILGDSVRFLQIVYNLLSNACKFCNQGHIRLEVQAMELYSEEEEDYENNKMNNTKSSGTTSGVTAKTVTMSHNRPIAMFASERTNKATSGRKSIKLPSNKDEDQQVFSMALLDDDDHSNNNNPHRRRCAQHADLEACCTEEGCCPPQQERVVLSITVADTGIGIPPERLEDIFEPYTQAKLSDFRQHGGTGLGLSIISSLTKTMGGTISVTSAPGQGAQFNLKLPVKLPSNNSQHHSDEHNDTTTAGGRMTATTTNQRRISISTNASSTTPTGIGGGNTSMDYVGELLPNDHKQVPQQFLKCQRMPLLTDYSSQDLTNSIAAAALMNGSSSHNHPTQDIQQDNSSSVQTTTTTSHMTTPTQEEVQQSAIQQQSTTHPTPPLFATYTKPQQPPPLFPTSTTNNHVSSPRETPIPTTPTPPSSAPLFMTNSSSSRRHYNNLHNSLEMSASGTASIMDMSVSGRTTNRSFNLPSNNHVVLCVDDNSVNRKILGKMLKGFGVEYRMACNGQEAVDALLQSRNYPSNEHNLALPLFGLVLLDISMPVMDGNEAIRIIRGQAKITVPIVALSANVLSQERDRTICLGADEFHSKPILRNNLHTICERYLLGSGRIPTTTTTRTITTRTGGANAVAAAFKTSAEAAASPLDTHISPLSRPPPTHPSSINGAPASSSCNVTSIGGASDCSTAATDATNSSAEMGLSESTSLQDLPALTRQPPQDYGALNV